MFTKLLKLSSTLSKFGFNTESKMIFVLAEKNTLVYSFVPKNSIDTIKEFGIASSEYIKNTPKLLEKIYPDKDEQRKWLDKFENKNMSLKGVNVFFVKPELKKIKNLDPAHPVVKNEYDLVEINLSKLLKDYPSTKIYGLELIPYISGQEYKENKTKIERWLSPKDITNFARKTFEDTWNNYLPGGGYFAANVPHGVVITPTKNIPTEYFRFV
jgi:hypothetical protein